MAPIAEKWFRSRRMNPPPLILSSPARRAKETVERISPSLYGTLGPVVFKENLYLPSIEDSLEVLRQQDDGIDRLAICSHNPGITRLAE